MIAPRGLSGAEKQIGARNVLVARQKKEKKTKYLVSAVAGALGILALTATNASAAIVCNAEGDCWHVKDKYDYKPE